MAKLFKGYLESDGKKPLSSVKNSENWLNEPPDNGDYVGILHEDIIQVDFDDERSAKIAMEIVRTYKLRCDILKTTRGVHLYFKNDGVKSQCVANYLAVGLKADIGLGSKSRVVPLKTTKEFREVKNVNGEEITTVTHRSIEREWLQTYDDIELVPCYFKPIGTTSHNLEKTSSRNDTLFRYILTLQTLGFSKEEVRKTIKLVNKHIVYEPLSDNEINVITRDDAFASDLFYNEDGKFLHDRFGNYMLSNCNIAMIDNQLHIYTQDSMYSNDPIEFERVMVEKIANLKENQRKEVYKYLVLKCSKKQKFASPKYIALKDEILDIETLSTIPYNPSLVMSNRIDFNYNPNAYHKTMDATLNKVACNDKQIRTLLEELIGYTLYRKNSMQVCFILTGEGSNGKSTMLNCIKNLLGKKNYTSLDLRELEDTFKPSELYNKLANIGDDISAKYLDNSSVFKKVVTGESFMVQKKYGQPFELESYATQIFCANSLPPVNDRTDGFSRRIVIVPFNARFSKTDIDYNPFIEEELMDDSAMEYLLKIAVEGLKRVIFNQSFTKSDAGEIEKEVYIRSNNNVLEWFDEEHPKIENEAVNDVYMMYQVWCTRNGYNAVKKGNLSKDIKKHLGLVSKPKSIDGKTTRVYIKEEIE